MKKEKRIREEEEEVEEKKEFDLEELLSSDVDYVIEWTYFMRDQEEFERAIPKLAAILKDETKSIYVRANAASAIQAFPPHSVLPNSDGSDLIWNQNMTVGLLKDLLDLASVTDNQYLKSRLLEAARTVAYNFATSPR